MPRGLAEHHFHSYEDTKEKGLILGLPQKMYHFSDMEFICCKKNGRKWSKVMGNTLCEFLLTYILNKVFIFVKKIKIKIKKTRTYLRS